MSDIRNCYECSVNELYADPEDTTLAKIVEYYCHEHNSVPDYDDIDSWAIILQHMFGMFYHLGDDYYHFLIRFCLDAVPSYITISDENYKKTILFAFAYDEKKDISPSDLDEMIEANKIPNNPALVHWYNWDNVIREFFTSNSADDTKSVIVMLDKAFCKYNENYECEDLNALNGRMPIIESTYYELLGPTFKDTLIEYIEKSGLKDSEVYKKAQVSRATFNAIINSNSPHSHKNTILAFAIALKLSIEDTSRLLESDGYAFKPSDITDCIVKKQIELGNYNLFSINEILVDNGQNPLGSAARNVN